jgi:hypothetical protein
MENMQAFGEVVPSGLVEQRYCGEFRIRIPGGCMGRWQSGHGTRCKPESARQREAGRLFSGETAVALPRQERASRDRHL